MKEKRFSEVFVNAGALSSVVEHYLHTVGVAGSKPAARTISPYIIVPFPGAWSLVLQHLRPIKLHLRSIIPPLEHNRPPGLR